MAKDHHFWKKWFGTTPAIVAWIVCILIIIALYFVVANQLTPYSSKATIYARVVSISPEVSGNIVESYTSLKQQFVPKGEVLFEVDPRPYADKLAIAKNTLVLTKERVAALTLQVSNLQKGVEAKQAAYTKAQEDYERYNKLYSDNVVSQQDTQHMLAAMQIKRADLAQSKLVLKAAKQHLGKTIDGINVHVRLAQAQLHLAQYYFDQTRVKAPTDGYYENLYIHKGTYAVPGQTKIPFILADTWWVEGLVAENGLSNLKMGQKALVMLDLYPGEIFNANVTSIGHGVQVEAIKPSGNLPEYSTKSAWFQAQQLFPFGVTLDPDQMKKLQLRVGASGSVVVLRDGHSIWNGFAYFVMWIKSLWAYL
ncbi:MAG: HlyD family secretion protein [Coxiellaceae bacterium]|nr:HlyD family secretion protein [Coxiellaceae bacterium]